METKLELEKSHVLLTYEKEFTTLCLDVEDILQWV